MKLIGIDLGGTNLRVGLLDGEAISTVIAEPINAAASENEIFDRIYSITDRVVTKDVTAIGIGVPSIVDVERGMVYNVQNIPSWKAVPLRERMEGRYNVPVLVNNDANCFVAAERRFGQGKHFRNVVGLILGTGVGAGLVLNGSLYAGSHFGAGEFGMIPYNGRILEAFSGGQFFLRKFHVRGEELARWAKSGDPMALSAFREFGEHVGHALTVILLALDPEIVILGGSVSKSFGLFERSMRSVLQRFPHPGTIEKLLIVPSTLDHAGILGAAALYYESPPARLQFPRPRD